MRLATLKNGTPDGRLVVVSEDHRSCVDAARIAPTLQAALDDWEHAEPRLRQLALDMDGSEAPTETFREERCESPLPRAFQWLDGSAYLNHVELVRKARGAEVPESFYDDPLMYQGGSDGFLGPRDPIPLGDPSWGADMEGEIAVVTDAVPMGVSESQARHHIKLVMLCNDVSLRGLIPAELGKGFGFVQGKPPSAFSPLALTPDALGKYWDPAGLLKRELRVDYRGKPFGRARAHQDATFTLARLVSHAAKTRPLCPGTIIGSGTVSNKDEDGGPGKPVAEGGRGYSCIAEIRMIEKIRDGEPSTPFMKAGDTVRIEACGDDGKSLFGAIEQAVLPG